MVGQKSMNGSLLERGSRRGGGKFHAGIATVLRSVRSEFLVTIEAKFYINFCAINLNAPLDFHFFSWIVFKFHAANATISRGDRHGFYATLAASFL